MVQAWYRQKRNASWQQVDINSTIWDRNTMSSHSVTAPIFWENKRDDKDSLLAIGLTAHKRSHKIGALSNYDEFWTTIVDSKP